MKAIVMTEEQARALIEKLERMANDNQENGDRYWQHKGGALVIRELLNRCPDYPEKFDEMFKAMARASQTPQDKSQA